MLTTTAAAGARGCCIECELCCWYCGGVPLLKLLCIAAPPPPPPSLLCRSERTGVTALRWGELGRELW